MHGNVWELCQDWYGDYVLNPVIDPKGPGKGESRVLRGGSWLNGARILRSDSRGKFGPGGRDNNVGFRVARDL
jgi:formylglycine-generating enzyme required for sulfatase activity